MIRPVTYLKHIMFVLVNVMTKHLKQYHRFIERDIADWMALNDNIRKDSLMTDAMYGSVLCIPFITALLYRYFHGFNRVHMLTS